MPLFDFYTPETGEFYQRLTMNRSQAQRLAKKLKLNVERAPEKKDRIPLG